MASPTIPPNSLHRDSQDWLLSAVDPFHDFEHPIEGAPDRCVSKSFTRVYSQQAIVSATADDDNITIAFWGFHGGAPCYFTPWGGIGTPATPTAGNDLNPVSFLRAASGTVPSLESYLVGGGTTLLGGFNTCQTDAIPSRVVSMGIEITDTTPSLYRKGTICAAHSNGEKELGHINILDNTPVTRVSTSMDFIRKPMLPITVQQLVANPGAYVGPAAKGLYLVARLNEIQSPARGRFGYADGTTRGSLQAFPLLQEPVNSTDPNCRTYYATNPAGQLWNEMQVATTWTDSGFAPFSILIQGVADVSTFQIAMKTTVEYFPQYTHQFECGLATYSPMYEPQAFHLYHEIMRQMPTAVPVGMNAAGDYWRMVAAIMRKVASRARDLAPYVGNALQVASALGGGPLMGAVGTALANVSRAQKPKQPASSKRAPTKRPAK